MPQYGNTPTDCEDKLSGYFYALRLSGHGDDLRGSEVNLGQ